MGNDKALMAKLVIFALLSLIFVAILPSQIMVNNQKKDVDNAIDRFNFYADQSDSIFYDEFAQSIPKTIEGFKFKDLRELNRELGLKSEKLIAAIKKPHGSPWITNALGTIIVTLVERLAISVVNSNIHNSYYNIILSLIGFLIIFIYYKLVFGSKFWEKQKQRFVLQDEDQRQLPDRLKFINNILVIILVLFIGYLIVVSLPVNLKMHFAPITFMFGELNFGSVFLLISVVILLGMIFLLGILIGFFKKRYLELKKLYTLIWLIPVLCIGFNLWFSTKNTNNLKILIDTQNYNNNYQKLIAHCNKIAITSRQWYLQNSSEGDIRVEDIPVNELEIQLENELGKFKTNVKNNKIIIDGKGTYTNREGDTPEAQVSYDPKHDKIEFDEQ